VDNATPDLTQPLSRMLAGQATVHDVSDTFGADFEVFMRVGAPPQSVQSIRRALQNDPAVESVRYISPEDALAVFRREFANDPTLIEGTQAADLPASFRVIVRAGQPKPAVANRYWGRTDVDTVISSEFPQAVAMSLAMQVPGAQVAALGGVDAEIFLRVGASGAEIQGVQSALERDSEVKSFQVLDQQQAFAIFAEEFSDQPAIVRQTKPSDLPVSFRVKARSGPLPSAFESKYRALAGVDTVIEPGSPQKPTASPCP
jgi:cell division protein FtsX